jgi:RNA polymerase sigma-70 factor (ECF subfamily)
MLRRRPSPDPSAFADDVLQFLEPLYRTALRLTRDRADAEDLVQDTIVKALRFSTRFESGTNLKAWLYTILHNTWRNRRRDAARDAVEVDSTRVDEAASVAGGPSEPDTPERILMSRTLDEDLQAALDEMPEAFREAVWLRDVEEFSYAEIAEMLGVPIGTVMSRISRGRRTLFERLRHTREEVRTSSAARRGDEPNAGVGRSKRIG